MHTHVYTSIKSSYVYCMYYARYPLCAFTFSHIRLSYVVLYRIASITIDILAIITINIIAIMTIRRMAIIVEVGKPASANHQ